MSAKSSPKRWDRVDGPRSWIVAFACMFGSAMVMGIGYTSGVYFVIFVQEFKEGSGKTSLISSINYGSMCVIGACRPFMSSSSFGPFIVKHCMNEHRSYCNVKALGIGQNAHLRNCSHLTIEVLSVIHVDMTKKCLQKAVQNILLYYIKLK